MLNIEQARRIAACYPPEARHTPAWERHRHLTDTQHLAWMLRFDPGAAAEFMSANHRPSLAEIWPTAAPSVLVPHGKTHHG
jgi:hypothetical protein